MLRTVTSTLLGLTIAFALLGGLPDEFASRASAQVFHPVLRAERFRLRTLRAERWNTSRRLFRENRQIANTRWAINRTTWRIRHW